MQLTRAQTGRRRRNDAPRRHLARPRFDRLEDRTMLSTWTVTDNSDDPNDTGSLRYAIDNAPDGTTINFEPIDADEVITLLNGPLSIKTNLDIEGPDKDDPLGDSLTVDGNHGSSVFEIASVTVTIAGLLIANGNSISGGGIDNGGTLTLAKCSIENNVATHDWWKALNSFGGGIYNAGMLTITHSELVSNSARDGGGGIYNVGTLTVNNCSFRSNSTNNGGGILTYNGGGILNQGKLTANNSTFSNNVSLNGGGIKNDGSATLTDCTLSTNSAPYAGYGGGIDNDNGNKQTELVLVNCTLAGNQGGQGGGIYNGEGTLTLINCTLSQNHALNYSGGGVGNLEGNVTLVNTIIAGNTVDSIIGTGPDVDATVNSLGHNLIGNTRGSNGWTGTDLLNSDPLLAPLGGYGGTMQTMPPLFGSPAIDSGDNVVVTNGELGPPPVLDQRGLNRVINGIIDIGACEWQGFIVTVSSGDQQATTVGTAFAAPLVVSVTSADFEPVAGVTVHFFLSPDSRASCTFPNGNPNVVVDSTGRAAINVVANTNAGSYSVYATTTTGNYGSNAVFSVTNVPDVRSQLVIQTQPSPTATAWDPFSIQPVVYVEDQYGNLETGDNSTTIFAQANTGSLGGTLVITVAGGVGSFTDLYTANVGTISLNFTNPFLNGATSNDIVVSPQVPYKLVVDTQPSSTATAGQPFATQPVIMVVDSIGQLLWGDNSTQVTASLRAGSGALLGTTTLTVSDGAVTFGDGNSIPLQDNTAGTITILFSSGTLLGAASDPIVISPAPASQLAIRTQPSPTATAGQPFAIQPVIELKDQYGNLETGDNTTQVTASLRAGSGALLGTTTVSVSGGVATFGAGSNLPLQDNTAGTITILFSSGTLAGAASDPIVISPAAASQLAIRTQPSPTATAGQPFAIQPVIELKDQYGNLETGDNTTQVTAGLNAGIGPLGGTTTARVTGGVARFTDLVDTLAESISLLFTGAPTVSSATSTDVVVNPAPPYKLVVGTQPSPTATAGKPFYAQPVVFVADRYGNLIASDNTSQVTASLHTGVGPLQGTTTVRVSGGFAVFTNLADNRIGDITLAFSSNTGIASATSSSISVEPARPAALVIHTQPSRTATVSRRFARQPLIDVVDRFGNLEIGDNSTKVTASLRVGHGPLLGTTTVTVSGGIAQFTNLANGKAETIILKFTSRGLAQALANPVTVKRVPFARLNRFHASRGAPSTKPWIFTRDALDFRRPSGAEITWPRAQAHEN